MLLDHNEFASLIHPALAPVIYWIFQIYLKIAHLVYVVLNFNRQREIVPKLRENDKLDQLLLLSASDAARKIWQKEITSSELLEAYIQRAELANKTTNAIAQRNYDFARVRAQQVDEHVRSLDENSQEYKELIEKKPFLGVPLSVKDHIGVKGIKLTIGLPVFKDNPPMSDDAEVIKRLMNAGAIPFVYSNVPEGVMFLETENTIYGRSNNPYDSRKGVGGSSGGEGALLGSGASVLGIGSDIGGSIRVPAMFNGVFGLKPTPKIISWKGCVPDKFVGYQADMASLGPLTRYAKDLKPMLKILVDPEHLPALKLDEPVDLDSLRVFYMEGPNSSFTSPLDSDAMGAFQKAVSHFQETRGQSAIRVDLPLVKYATDIWFVGLVSGGAMPVPNFFTGFNPDKALDGWAEVPKFLSGKSEHVLPVILWCICWDFFAKFEYDSEKRIKIRETLKKQFLDLLGDDGILIYPSYPHSGYFHNEPILTFSHMDATTIWNALAFPCASVPMGLNSNGSPTAVQIVATPNNDRLVIKVAEELGNVFGGWKMPQGPEQRN